jgi:hypothetical protein
MPNAQRCRCTLTRPACTFAKLRPTRMPGRDRTCAPSPMCTHAQSEAQNEVHNKGAYLKPELLADALLLLPHFLLPFLTGELGEPELPPRLPFRLRRRALLAGPIPHACRCHFYPGSKGHQFGRIRDGLALTILALHGLDARMSKSCSPRYQDRSGSEQRRQQRRKGGGLGDDA